MRSTKQLGLGLIAFTIMVKALMIPVVYIDFKVNQDYISRVLCMNRDQPELKCNGHCILMQKLKKAQETEQSQEEQSHKKEITENFCESLFDFKSRSFPPGTKEYRIYQSIFFSHYNSDIFHPPRA